MVVIADASPLNYLVLIEQIELLHRSFGEVLVPDAVIEELNRSGTPHEVARWMADRPDWVRRVANPPFRTDPVLDRLGKGERAAIALAETLRTDVLLVIDEAKGRRVAVQRQIPVVGILGILDAAAALGWINLTDVLARLQGTSFRITPDVIASMLERDTRRKSSGKLFKETD